MNPIVVKRKEFGLQARENLRKLIYMCNRMVMCIHVIYNLDEITNELGSFPCRIALEDMYG